MIHDEGFTATEHTNVNMSTYEIICKSLPLKTFLHKFKNVCYSFTALSYISLFAIIVMWFINNMAYNPHIEICFFILCVSSLIGTLCSLKYEDIPCYSTLAMILANPSLAIELRKVWGDRIVAVRCSRANERLFGHEIPVDDVEILLTLRDARKISHAFEIYHPDRRWGRRPTA